MRIGIDARMYRTNFTGIGRYVFELVRNLAQIDEQLPSKQRHEYVLFFNDPEYETFQPPSPAFTKIRVNALHYSLREQISFLKILNAEQLDLMHFTHFNAPILYRKPSVATIHDLILSFYPGKKLTKFWYRAGYHLTLTSILKHAQTVIAVSEHTKKDLRELYKIPEEKIQVIYEGVSDEFRKLPSDTIQKIRDTYDLTKPFFLYAGVWRNHKNLVNLLRAFRVLREKLYQDALLVITGEDDPVYPEVKETVLRLGLEAYVRFPGMVNEGDLVALYNAATAYVHPSLYEGFGLNILEAFACGTPVVSSNASCLPEIAGEGNVVFFDPNNVNDMAEKMKRVLADDILKARLCEKGLKRVKDFSWRKMGEATREVYCQFF